MPAKGLSNHDPESPQTLAHGRQRERLAMEATGFGFWEWHVASGVVRWDDRMFELYGRAPTEDGVVSFDEWAEAVFPEEQAPWHAALRAIADGVAEPGRRHTRIRRHDNGETRFIETVDAVRRDADGRIEWVVGLNWDCTARELDRRELEEKNKELEQFVYTASHDLKSPIVTILGYASYLMRDLAQGRTEELESYGQRIRRAAERMRDHVDDLLQLSRVGRAASRPGRVCLTEVVSEVLASREREIEEQGIVVELRIEQDTVWCDRAHLVQVLDNLIGNAIAYGCDDGHARVRVTSQEAEGGFAEIGVDDDGPGIAAEYAERVFGLFERLRSDKNGTGIGLTIVRSVAELYGGRAWVESDAGPGGRMRVTLPSKESAARPGARPRRASSDEVHETPDPVPAR